MHRIRDLFLILAKHGVVNFYLKIRNHFKIWEIPPSISPKVGGSSISDADFHSDYLELVERAGDETQIFDKFRSCSAFINILDHVSIQHGEGYISEIKTLGRPQILGEENLKLLKSIDSVGGGLQYHFRGVGKISPAYLRYLKVLGDLEMLFGEIADLRIAEIGIGFGGQGLVLNRIAGAGEISFYDLPPVLNLASRYFNSTNTLGNFRFIDGRDPQVGHFDLVISNYAFSELSRSIQEMYLKKVVLNSKHGYITWNDLAFQNLGSFSLAELLRLIPNSQILAEAPLTARNNSIIYW
jgi:hypothetical protein